MTQVTYKFAKPHPGEEALRFVMVEPRGDRALFGAVCDMPFKPTQVLMVADLVEA